MIKEYKGIEPKIDESSYIDENCSIIGDVVLEENTSVWPFASIRGDEDSIHIGRNSNVQDNAVIHGKSTIGEGVSVGHSAIIHGAEIGNNVIVGMGAIILNGAKIGNNCIVGAGSLITGNKVFEENTMILGSPAKAVRKLTDNEIEGIKENSQEYLKYIKDYNEYK